MALEENFEYHVFGHGKGEKAVDESLSKFIYIDYMKYWYHLRIFKVSWIFKNSKRIIMNHQQSLFSQKTYPNMIRWDKMI